MQSDDTRTEAERTHRCLLVPDTLYPSFAALVRLCNRPVRIIAVLVSEFFVHQTLGFLLQPLTSSEAASCLH